MEGVSRAPRGSGVSGVSGVSGDDSSRVIVPGVSVRRGAAVPASRWEGGGGGSEGGGGGGPAGEGCGGGHTFCRASLAVWGITRTTSIKFKLRGNYREVLVSV